MKLSVPAVGLLVAAVSSAALGTTFVDISDGRLADRATLIVEAVVLDRGAAPVVDRPATDYAVRIEAVLKGSVSGSVIVVRAPGGLAPDGLELRVWGAPRLKRGDRAVLFLEPTAEGVYRFVDLALGSFLQVGLEGGQFLIRDLRELHQLAVEDRLAGSPAPPGKKIRDRQRFQSWLSARAEGIERPADYFLSLGAHEALRLQDLLEHRGSFALGDASKLHGDWTVDWYLEERAASQPSLVRALRTALERWELARGDRPPIRLAGVVKSAGGFSRYDGANTVILGDPEAQGSALSRRGCPPEGIVSVSGTWFESEIASQDGPSTTTALGGDVQLLLDAECLAGMMEPELSSVFGQELPSFLPREGREANDSRSGQAQSAAVAETSAVPPAFFAPEDLDNLELYFVSTDFGPDPIATCNTQYCYDNQSESTDISGMYCDTVADAIPGATGYAPEGCVRWFEDQGPFDCGTCGTGDVADEWVRGHRYGQDDWGKPAYIADCVNGQPCADLPTISEMGPNAINQPACWESEWNDLSTVTGDFSIFFLVNPEDQASDWWYFGHPNNGLLHNAVDDSLSFRAGGGPTQKITTVGAVDVSGNSWQLIEIHREGTGEYQVFINEVDVTAPGPPIETADYTHRWLGAMNCNPGHVGMAGKLAAFVLYSDRLTLSEQNDVRTYLDSIYNYSGSAVSSQPSPKGYEARACGFDMDDDLVYGEPADDCNVCDGVTTDVDGDGQDEDLIYVDCDAGIDQAGCGIVASPCETLDYALNSVANGPGTGQEDIICFRGTCSQDEDIVIGLSGKSGTKTRLQSGSEARDFEYPSNPAMIVGWDQDDDGEYPPFDADDTAVLYGGAPGCYFRAFRMASSPVSFLELAHFTARAFGTCEPGTDGGFMYHRGLGGGSTNSHHYFHDLVMDDVNRGRYGYGGRIMFNLFLGSSRAQWFAWENIDIRNAGGYNARGESVASVGATDSGPLRFQSISRTCLSGEPAATGGGQCVGYKLWGYYTGVEVIDNVFDLQPEAFEVRESQSSFFGGARICMRDVVYRNNLIRDQKLVFSAAAYGGGVSSCDAPGTARPVDDVIFDRNIWVNEYDWGSQGWDASLFLSLGECENVQSTIEDVEVTNNLVYNKFGGSKVVEIDCALSDSGPNPGQWIFANNTIHSPEDVTFGVIDEKCNDCANPPCAYAENIIFKNNVIDVPAGNIGMRFDCSPAGFVNDHNTYSPGVALEWGGVPQTWGEWKSNTQGDGNSKICAPEYVDSANGDLHLAATDTCAVDSGETLSWLTTVDVDGDSRGAGLGWDVGGDESGWYLLSVEKAGAGSGTVTSVPNGINCGVDCAESYNPGAAVIFNVGPDLGSEFGGWSGNPDCADGAVTVIADLTCTASFDACSIPSDVQLDPPAQPIDTVESYEGCNILRAGTGGFPIVGPGDVTFRAGNRIELQDGFSVGPGAVFSARIGPP